jgi:hypothetical protein
MCEVTPEIVPGRHIRPQRSQEGAPGLAEVLPVGGI